MRQKRSKVFVCLALITLSLAGNAAFADSSAKLDRPYRAKKGILTSSDIATRMREFFNFDFDSFALPKASDLKALLDLMTPVKSQGERGTCSIFSMTALVEAELIREFGLSKSTNLSEQWLAYLVVHNNGDEGSEAYINLDLISDNGMASEKTLPYNETTWEKTDVETNRPAKKACGWLRGQALKMCLLAQKPAGLLELSDSELASRDPEMYKAYKSASMMQSKYLGSMSGSPSLGSESQVKKLLAAGIPVIAEMDFYYGAWNHREALDLGIQRQEELFAQGVVGYPAPGSVDRAKSTVGKAAAGHSILLIGYDDEREVTTTQKMVGGGMKTFTYKGVYYFKNSWGTDSFGVDSNLNGYTPGYGMITQAYANEFAAFYKFPWKQ